jgi:glycine cleavage system transcriptional repressor
MARAVISTIGRDRPGIVNELTEAVSNLGLNIDDSRMTVLGGEFAVLMSVTGNEEPLEQLRAELENVCAARDTAFLFRRTEERSAAATLPYRVRVVAMDHPGIVQGIASFFSARQINIRDLNTETERAAHTGTPIFNLTMTVEVPAGVKVRELREAFEGFCDERDLDGALEAA